MTAQTHSIKTDVYFIPRRRGPTATRYVAAIDGVWLVRKDGVIRKFHTRKSARAAAMNETKTRAA